VPTAPEHEPRIPRGTGLILFLTAWIVFSFFHQGGGRHQNVRFAMTRAVVENGRFDIDSQIFYSGIDTISDPILLLRIPLAGGSFYFRDGPMYLTWADAVGERVAPPLAGEDAQLLDLSRVAASPYVSFADGRFHPNKAPGATLLSVPAYFVLHRIQQAFAMNPDGWWLLTLNAWLSSAFSVGLLSAFGCWVFFRLALLLWGRPRDALLATLAFGFGTLFLPYATMLFEHNVVAVGLLTAVWLVYRAWRRVDALVPRPSLLLAGVAAGLAVISDFLSAVVVLFLAVWIWHRMRRARALVWFGLGLLLPLLLLAGYNQACFGTPFTTNYHFQHPDHPGAARFLAVLGWPQLERLPILLFSPFRGLFLLSPVLLAGAAGLVAMWRSSRFRPEAVLFTAIFGYYLLFNVSFLYWHSYWACGPRFLIPAVPFLALPVAWALGRYFKAVTALAILSVAVMGLFTVVDPQSPVGVASIAGVPGKAKWQRSPLTEYALPIFLDGRPTPVIEARRQLMLERTERALDEENATPEVRAERLEKVRNSTDVSLLSHWRGPVSANPVGVYESWVGRSFPADSEQARWNSFNAGELLLPGRLSLILLAILIGPMLFWLAFAVRGGER
jgi:hypothetical protein